MTTDAQTPSSVVSPAPSDAAHATGTVSPVAHIVNLAAIAVGLLTVWAVLAGMHGPARVWLAVLLFTFGPGSGLVQFLRIPEGAMQLGLIVGLSAAIDIILGQSLLWVHNLDGDAAVCILAGITLIRPLRFGRVRSTPSAASTADQGLDEGNAP